jgi:transcriptional regulator with XRE-family HTH domain
MAVIDWVERLKKIQEDNNMSHARFARKLRIDRTHWWRLRHGKAHVGPRLINRALQRFPSIVSEAELRSFILPVGGVGRHQIGEDSGGEK